MDLYFSWQQKRHCQEILPHLGHTYLPIYGKLEDGRIVEYTEMVNEGNKPVGNFNDFIFLGKGEFYKHHLDVADEVQLWLTEQFAEDDAWKPETKNAD